MNPIRSLILLCVMLLITVVAMPKSIAEDWLYIVRKGDTIWELSHKYLKDPLKFKDIQAYNKIELDRHIPPGTTLKFPMEYLKFAPAEVKVISINGSVFFVRRGVKEPLTTDNRLVLDDIVLTEKESNVALLFADGSELLLGENSELIFDVQTQWGETGMVDSRMRLMKGSAEGRVERLIGPGANFEVQTPSAVATVRGTEFRVRVNKNDSSVVFSEVDEGNVAVQLHENKALVKQGFGLRTSTSLPMSEPKPLLPKPIFVNVQEKYAGYPVTITWQPIDGAKSYIAEVFKDVAMTNMVSRKTLQQNQLTISGIPLGDYSVRIRAVDVDGLQGLNHSVRFTVSPVPGIPTTQQTTEQFLAGQSINMSWLPLKDASRYRWRLLKEGADKPLSQLDTGNPTMSIQEGLEAGSYHWQVAAGNSNGFGPYSKARSFTVTLPRPPVMEDIESELDSDQTFTVRWSAVELAQSYQWQVSDDADFKTIIKEGNTQRTQVALSDLPEQTIYIRVAAIGPYNDQRYSDKISTTIIEPGNGKTAFSIGSVLLFILLL